MEQQRRHNHGSGATPSTIMGGSVAGHGVDSTGHEVEIDAVQEEQGNSFARQQLTSQATSEPPPSDQDPWMVDLFSATNQPLQGSDSSMLDALQEQEWERSQDRSINVDGGIQSQTLQDGQPVVVGQGQLGKLTREHNSVVENYDGLSLSTTTTGTRGW